MLHSIEKEQRGENRERKEGKNEWEYVSLGMCECVSTITFSYRHSYLCNYT